MAGHLRPWDRPDIFEPVLATTPILLGCIRLKVLDRVASERYGSCLRDVQAGGGD